jgi:hypothetical protein
MTTSPPTRLPTGFIDSPFRPKDLDFGLHELFGSRPVGAKKWLHDFAKHGLDQYGTESCTSFGGGQVIYVNQGTLGVPEDDRVFPSVNGSYFQSRARKWGYDKVFDIGSALHDFWEGCLDFGLISDKDLPFDPIKINDAPKPHLYRKASDNDFLKYRWILDPPGSRERRVRQTLDADLALTVAVEVDESFRQWQMSHGPWERKYSRLGSHLMGIVGYEEAGAWVINSHGPGFGEGGLILIDWAYIENPECRGFSTAEFDMNKLEKLLRKFH